MNFMRTFNEFYNGLDFLNLILFWGVIIVIILIIIFLTLYFSRKKRIIIVDKEEKRDFDDIDILKTTDDIKNSQSLELIDDKNLTDKIKLDNDSISFANNDIELNTNEVTDTLNDIHEEVKTVSEEKDELKSEYLFDGFVRREEDRPRAYQRNVFREMNARGQTSPIGIVTKKEDNVLTEYKESMSEPNDRYLEDVYSSLEKASVPDKIELTDYEKRQEEDAVISYQELIKKKDTIDYSYEEDVPISYGELLGRSDKLYNIREEEQDQEFLSELKKFRRDL